MNCLHHILYQKEKHFAAKPAIIFGDTIISYGELVAETEKMAKWLQVAGLKKEDRLIIFLPNHPMVIKLIMAASRIGVIFIVINDKTTPATLQRIIGNAVPSCIVSSGQYTGIIAQATAVPPLLIEEIDLHGTPLMVAETVGNNDKDAIAGLIYTSGSTGEPKGIATTHRNILFSVQAIQQALDIRETDIIGSFLPLSFDYGLYQVFLAFNVGATIMLGMEGEAGPLIANRIVETKITCLPINPHIFEMLVKLIERKGGGCYFPDVRLITNTGSYLSYDLILRFKQYCPHVDVALMFGLTECKRVSILPPAKLIKKKDSVGIPLSGTRCFIIDQAGNEVERNTRGELIVQGEHVTAGYWNNAIQTHEKFRVWAGNNIRSLFTGDTCSMDEDGYLYFYGRNDELLKNKGFRISALEIEQEAARIVRSDKVAVVSAGNENSIILLLEKQASISESMLLNALRECLEEYKVPDRVIFVDAIPRNVNGKIDKKALKLSYGL
ncbi:class I adenylate-forming enzyme family protein [Chitinophaga sp. 22321]|uniref:Acyl--CoA ligase n=1 Tax=Chitinophaga hostae TaxID=2831022 RepID=A0ABS5J979_9BACT|nr:class I adenylate-forming enzyme family protein [Chitinophaga hostae]MBS0031778.1 acyl--CoA ligase [Chitinophaga hostae]